MKFPLFVLGSFVCFATTAHGSVTPTPSELDPHIQSILYDDKQVVALKVAAGYALTLEFAPDEHVETVALGNSNAWQVTPNKSADHLFIKPLQLGVLTNMTVVTGQRTYTFELSSLTGPDPKMAYLVRFNYPVPPKAEIAVNDATGYDFHGAKAIKPSEMSDDGSSTIIAWPAGSTAPAIYAVEDDGHESLVNATLRGNKYLIDRIASAYVFRLGKLQAKAVRHKQRLDR